MTLRTAPRHLQGLPTLTEVVELTVPADSADQAAQAAPAGFAAGLHVGAEAPLAALQQVDEAELVARVLVELQHFVGLTLEDRMREVMQSALALAGETLVRELRSELAVTLHEVVARSVSEELERQRQRAAAPAGPP